MLEMVSRSQAVSGFLKRYFTGEPCKHGHVCERRTIDRKCVACGDERARKWAKDNPEKAREAVRRCEAKHPEEKRRELTLEEFQAAAKKRGGDPEKSKEANRAWRAANPEKMVEARRRQYLANPEKFRERGRIWRIENLEKVKESYLKNRHKYLEKDRERARRRYYSDPRAHIEYCKGWARKNVEYVKCYAANWKAKRLGTPGEIKPADLLSRLELQNYRCAYCACCIREEYDVDHITPFARGGSNFPSNVHLTCPACNAQKGAKTHEEFITVTEKNQNEQRHPDLGPTHSQL